MCKEMKKGEQENESKIMKGFASWRKGERVASGR